MTPVAKLEAVDFVVEILAKGFVLDLGGVDKREVVMTKPSVVFCVTKGTAVWS